MASTEIIEDGTTLVVLSGDVAVGPAGNDGDNGWSPYLAVVADGARSVLQVVDWTGGQGTKPTTGGYIGATGIVSNIADAVDIRGATGASYTIPTYTWAALQQVVGTSGQLAFASDIGPVSGTLFNYNLTAGLWRTIGSTVTLYANLIGYINFGGSGAAYSQSGTLVSVAKTAHGLTSDQNGSYIFLTPSTGTFVAEWCSNLTIVDANNFQCTSAVNRTASGNLAGNVAETVLPWSYQAPSGLIKTKDNMAISFIIKGTNSAGLKTIKPSYSGVLISGAAGNSITAGGAYTNSGAAAQIFMSNNTFITSGISAVVTTDTNRTYTVSSTLSATTDWHYVVPFVVSHTPRFGL